jgi:3-keto-disaccharide hydrolase
MKLSTTFALVLALVCTAGMAMAADKECCSATKTPACCAAKGHPDSSKWEDLFKADLSNAITPKTEDGKDVWTSEKGELTASHDKNIWTKKDYTNFVVDLEFKTGKAANSGVILRCSDLGKWIPNSFEVQILDDKADKWKDVADNWKCGGIFGRKAASVPAGKVPGEWNRMTVTCVDAQVCVILNGKHVLCEDLTKYTDAKKNPDGSEAPSWLSKPLATLPTKGKVGLQGKHGGANIWFRKMKLKALD